MKAIILAAGRGSRIPKLTKDKPKCLIELVGKTLLEWQIEALNHAGLKDIIIVTGYKKECLKNTNCMVIENTRWQQTNMVMSLCCAKKNLEQEDCIVSYADILYHPDLITKLISASEDIAITYDKSWKTLWEKRFSDPLKDAETFRINSNGRIEDIGRRASSFNEIQGQYMGLLKITPNGWNTIEATINKLSSGNQDKLDITLLLQILIKEGLSIQAVPVDGKWCEVDSEKDVALYQKETKNSESVQSKWEHDWRW